jgi:hypothetical protein
VPRSVLLEPKLADSMSDPALYSVRASGGIASFIVRDRAPHGHGAGTEPQRPRLAIVPIGDSENGARAGQRLTLRQCRECLPPDFEVEDNELERVRDAFYALAEVMHDAGGHLHKSLDG